jgi:pimeloyl-ACP methyl ester carboxylesterase
MAQLILPDVEGRPLLTDPERYGGNPSDSFDVVVPSMPGYGFSERPAERGMVTSRIAHLWAKLMTEVLGYRRFGAQGGDIGAGVTTRLGLLHANKLIGIHITDVARPYLGPGAGELSEAEKISLAEEEQWDQEEGAYSSIQATRPQTLAYGLNDSPAGLAAWIVEKFRAWSDCDGDVEKRFTKDELLTNVTIYWVTETINSSIRLYYEHRHNGRPLGLHDKVRVPTGVALFPKDLSRPPREWAERTYHVKSWTQMPRGGHFAAMEEPNLLVEDIRAFFRPLR